MGGLTFKHNGSLKVFIRPEGTPSLHHMWYVLDAIGEVSVNTLEPTQLKPKLYQVKIEADHNGRIFVVDQDSDMYSVVARVYHRVVGKLIQRGLVLPPRQS
jgi:hypothetical protein